MSNDNSRGRSSSPRPRTWSAADSDKCECVLEVMTDDVLLGRGSGPNDHVGNIKFRDLVHERKAEYLSTNHRQTKAMIAKDIVDQVYARGGRFLKKLSAVESDKMLPRLLADRNAMDDSENDSAGNPGACDVYQIQKHATVMEKAKQALRQNQRNASPDLPESPNKGPDATNARRDSLGRVNKISPDTPSHGILLNNNNNNNWNGMNGMAMGNIPTTLNNSSPGNPNQYPGGNLRETFDLQNNGFSNPPQGRNQDSYQQQMFQQQQDLMNLQKQHDLLQMQYQQRQQQNQQQQYQSQQLEVETHNQLLQEQLELQIRQEQLRHLQQQSLQKLASNAGVYSKHQQGGNNDQQFRHSEHSASQSSPPAVLNGYATYTTTLDAIEDSRHTSNDGLADPHEMLRGDVGSVGNLTDPGKMHDDKSMQLSTMMGSFKDLSVKSGEDHEMHGSTDTIGTIENVPAGLSMVHMSGISMMSMMNDSTDSLFKNPQKAGNDIGGKNASWGSTNSPTPNSSQAPLADVIESHNPAAAAAAAVLGKQIPGFDKAQRRWSGGYIPSEVPVQIKSQRVNRRGSLQFTSSNASNELNQMQATATAMLAMAQAEHEKQEQSFNYHHSSNGQMNYGHDMMNHSNQGYHMDNGAYGMNMNTGYHNN